MRSLSREVSVAARAVERGAEVIRAATLDDAAAVRTKGVAGDYVTEVDIAAERAILDLLETEGGGIGVHGEERGGPAIEDRGEVWVVDPLDGTTNFAHGFWAVGVSVALVRDGSPAAGAVCAPFLGQTWVAGRGEGAWLDGAGSRKSRLRVSDRDISRAVVATGHPFRRKELLTRYMRMFEVALSRFEDLRRPGAASLDLAWVSAGVFDGFFELALAPWDVAAGGLLIEEAGGSVTDWSGGDDWMGGDILAGPPGVQAELRSMARMTADVS